MIELISRVFSKYGIGSLIGMLLAVLGIWAVVHSMSAPGEKISVIWGLVEYTKPQVNLNKKILADKPHKMATNNNDFMPEKIIKEPISIFSKNIKKNELKTELLNLRIKNSLRPLVPFESGKNISDTPRGTYFFSIFGFFGIESNNFLEKIQSYEVSSYPKFNNIEIHHSGEGKFYFLGFVTKSHAAELSQLSGLNKKKVLLSSVWHSDFSTLVRLPAIRIVSSINRTLNMKENLSIEVLDLEIQ